MAQLKDLIVNGASQLTGDVTVNTIQITKINAPTVAGGSTYGGGTTGNVLTSNGTSVYWSPITITQGAITGLKTLTIGTATCQVFANNDITIPIYDGTIEDTLLAAEGVSF